MSKMGYIIQDESETEKENSRKGEQRRADEQRVP
jgi:hypothetical protein